MIRADLPCASFSEATDDTMFCHACGWSNVSHGARPQAPLPPAARLAAAERQARALLDAAVGNADRLADLTAHLEGIGQTGPTLERARDLRLALTEVAEGLTRALGARS